MRNFLTIHNLVTYLNIIKYYFLASVIVFVLSILVGIYLGNGGNSFLVDLINTSVEGISNTPFSFESITLSNIRVALMITAGGIFFSVLSVIILFYNGLIIGFLGCMYPTVYFLAFILPHGIFELPALMLACALAFMITHFICRLIRGIFSRKIKVMDQIRKSYPLLRAMLVTFILFIVLLVVAGYIETNITEIIGTIIVWLVY